MLSAAILGFLFVIYAGWLVLNLFRFGIADVQQPFPAFLSMAIIVMLFLSGFLQMAHHYIVYKSFTLGQLLTSATWAAIIGFFAAFKFIASWFPCSSL